MPKWGDRPHGCLPKCIDCRRAESREYWQQNPHKKWANSYRQRAKALGFKPIIEEFLRDQVLERYGDGCFYCSVGSFEQLDHYVPIELGGEHTLANVRPSCARCNIKKGRQDPRIAA
jgi:5-methylcytosine-specific restriction endonuclease McrA